MSSINTIQVLLITMACLMGVSMANRNWHFGRFNRTAWKPWKPIKPHGSHNATVGLGLGSNKILVGGKDKWRYGFNYTQWALQSGPFYLNDTLVFKFDSPSDKNPFSHNVYLLPSFWHFITCDFRGAKMIANATQGGGNEGFEYRLKDNWVQPYYFACSEHDGAHCKDGLMKFSITPLFKYT